MKRIIIALSLISTSAFAYEEYSDKWTAVHELAYARSMDIEGCTTDSEDKIVEMLREKGIAIDINGKDRKVFDAAFDEEAAYYRALGGHYAFCRRERSFPSMLSGKKSDTPDKSTYDVMQELYRRH